MKNTLLIAFVLLSFGLQAQQTEPKRNPEEKRFVYQTGTTIQKRPYDSIYFDVTYEKGKNWVFRYSQRAAEYPSIADDEYYESLEFEMAPPKGNSFTINSKDFEKHNVIFNRSCFCPDAGIRQVRNGRIIGKLTGKNTWFITFDVMIETRPGRIGLPQNKKLKGTFKPGKLNP